MQKVLVAGLILTAILILSVGVYAVENNSAADIARANLIKAAAIGSASVEGAKAAAALRITEQLRKSYSGKNCSSYVTVKERTVCRFINNETQEAKNSIPEACKALNLSKIGRCVAIHNAIYKCIERTGSDEDKCLKKAAGLTKAKLQDEKNDSTKQEKAREYIAGLFTVFENKIDKAQANGNLSESDAADLIAQITQIKQDVLGGKTRAEIKPEVDAFKVALKDVINAGKIKDE